MRKLLYSISMSLIILFIYWVAIYYASGYNLTNNVAHLDLASMIKQFTNNLNSNEKFVFNTNGMDALTKLNDYFNSLFVKITDIIDNQLNIYTGSNSVFAIVLTGVRILVKALNTILQPINLLTNIINNIVYMLSNTIYFFYCFIKLLINPIFI